MTIKPIFSTILNDMNRLASAAKKQQLSSNCPSVFIHRAVHTYPSLLIPLTWHKSARCCLQLYFFCCVMNFWSVTEETAPADTHAHSRDNLYSKKLSYCRETVHQICILLEPSPSWIWEHLILMSPETRVPGRVSFAADSICVHLFSCSWLL